MRYLLLALLLTGCGGGGGSSSSPAPSPNPSQEQRAYTFLEFFPFLLGKSGSAVITDHSGNVFSTYSYTPLGPVWGNTREWWSIVSCVVGGHTEPWAVILGYEDIGKPLYVAEDVKTTWEGVEVKCPKGTPYAPVNLPQSGVYTIRQYGTINGTVQYYWQAEYTFGQSAMNVCWQGADPSRPVIWQREVWQTRGVAETVRGTVVGDPWLTTPSVIYDTRNAAGLDAGFLWVYQAPTGDYCRRT